MISCFSKLRSANGKCHYSAVLGSSNVNVPVYGAGRALSKRAWVAADGARGLLKYSTNNVAGMVLAVGPQAYLDYKSSTTMREFYKKSAYSQPTNVTAAAVGIASGEIILKVISIHPLGRGMALGMLIAVGWISSLLAQYVLVSTKTDKAIGGFLTDD